MSRPFYRSSPPAWVLFLALHLPLLLGAGCSGLFAKKPALRSPDPSQPISSQGSSNPQNAPLSRPTVEELDLRVVPLGRIAELPEASDAGKKIELVTEGSVAIAKNTLRLPRPEKDAPLFFVWNESVFASPIRQAFFTHRTQDPRNQLSGPMDRLPASFDPETRRWFIPLASLFPAANLSLDPAEQHWLLLDLLLANGDRLEFAVGLKLGLPLPPVQFQALSTPATPEASRFGSILTHQGHALVSESLQNPSRQRVALWIQGQGNLSFRTSVLLSRFEPRPDAEPTGPHWYRFESGASASLRGVRVHRGGQMTELPVTNGKWHKLMLNPFEKVELQWLAGRDPSAGLCQLPGPVTREIGWTWHQPAIRLGPFKTNLPGDVPMRVSVTEEAKVGGTLLQGRFQRRLILATPESAVTPEMIEGQLRNDNPELAETGAPLDLPVNLASGDWMPGNAPFHCQGFFNN